MGRVVAMTDPLHNLRRSGAAADVLAHFFPGERDGLDRLAAEASMSRVYGGIHFRFDCDEGLKLGRAVARLAIQHAGR